MSAQSHRMTEPMLSAVDGDGDDRCVNVVENARTVIASYATSEAALAFIHGYHAADKTLRAQRDALAVALRDLNAQIGSALQLGAQGPGYLEDMRDTVRVALAKVAS